MFGQILLGAANIARDRTFHVASATLMMPVAATTLHTVGLTTDLDSAKLAGGLLESSLWMTLASAALFGGLGGIVAELISLHGRIEMPHRVKHARFRKSHLADPRYEIDLGVLSRVVLGAAAALVLLAVYSPPTTGMLLVNALIAGSAATAVFRLVQRRLLAVPTLGVDQVQHQRGPAKVLRSKPLASERVEEFPHPATRHHLHGALGELGGNVPVAVRA